MQKKQVITVLASAGLLLLSAQMGRAADLLQVYNQAVNSDPVFKQARANYEVEQQNVPLSLAVMLPNLGLQLSDTYANNYTKTLNATSSGLQATGASNIKNISNTTGFALTLNQSIFNYTYWENLRSAKAGVKSAFATYTAAIQDLIQRTSQAYFDILDKRASLIYTEAEERAYYQQYTQALESYRVGVKTLTDVDQAKASYDSAKASVVSAKNDLMDARENLRVITGVYYKHISTLKRLPLVIPAPKNINSWTQITEKHNWQIVSSKYNLFAAHYNILSAEGGHLPTVDLQSTYTNSYQHYINTTGHVRTYDLNGELSLNMPIYQGGQVDAQVNQNIAQYRLAAAQLESTYRDVMNTTRQSYLGVDSGISKIRADYQAIISNRSSVKGTEEGYKVGTQTMLNVLQAEQNLYQALQTYSNDRYAYILSLINLKESAGTLSINDVKAINQWLIATAPSQANYAPSPPKSSALSKTLAAGTPPGNVGRYSKDAVKLNQKLSSGS